mgnify:CR=1 FL=1
MTAATPLSLTATRLFAGVWEAVLTAATDVPPKIEAWLDGAVLAQADVSPLPGQPGQWAVRVAIPAAILTDGVQTVLVQSGGEVLAKVTVIAGAPLNDDIRAELGLLRAELDLLKRSFQRQSRG